MPEAPMDNIGERAAAPKRRNTNAGVLGLVARFSRSVRVQLCVLLLIFSVPPILLHSVFGAAESEKQHLLLEAIRDNGRIVALALAPLLRTLQPGEFSRIPNELARFESDHRSIKILFRPTDGHTAFYYVASAPLITVENLAEERQQLVDLGILAQLEGSCSGDMPLGNRIMPADGQRQVILSVTPVQSPKGCWVIIVAANEDSVAGIVDGRAYWMRPETRIAAIVYMTMAILVLLVFATVWTVMARFKRTAATVEQGASFADATAIPELAQMGRVFDAMVGRFRHATELLRRAAEDNAHAFKGPLAVMRQATELLRRKVTGDATLGITAINTSLDRLEGLVRSAQHLDVATADLLQVEWSRVNLSDAVSGFVDEYQITLGLRSTCLVAEIEPAIFVNGRSEMLETILENLVDNAVSFSPSGGRVMVRLAADATMAVLSVTDEGPGIDPRKLPYIFDRYYSSRPTRGMAVNEDGPVATHFGIGLWLVRQNVHAMGGTVTAENSAIGGFTITVNLPRCASE